MFVELEFKEIYIFVKFPKRFRTRIINHLFRTMLTLNFENKGGTIIHSSKFICKTKNLVHAFIL